MSFQKNDFFPRFFFFSSHKTNGLFSLQATKLKKKKVLCFYFTILQALMCFLIRMVQVLQCA